VQDEEACDQWAQDRTGIDPTAVAVNAGKAAAVETFSKAMATCLQGRGYAVN
jgi:hypothetical protein